MILAVRASVVVWPKPTNLVDRAYDNFLIPALGFVFLPFTTLVYALAYDGHGLSALGWMFVALAFVADISSYRARRYMPQQA